MSSLEDKAIDAMTAEQLREELKALRSRYRAMHRRAQHSVPARERSDMQAQLTAAKEMAERRIDAWYFEFKRVCDGHQIVKQIFELAAKKLGLPHGMYHSVGDLPFSRKWDGGLYANVYLTPKGGIETFDVREAVEKAIYGEAA